MEIFHSTCGHNLFMNLNLTVGKDHTLAFSNHCTLVHYTHKKCLKIKDGTVLAIIHSVDSAHPNVLVNYKKALAE